MLIYEISRSAEYSEKQLAALIDDLSGAMGDRYMELYGRGGLKSDMIMEKYFELYQFFQNKYLEQFGSYFIPRNFPEYIEPVKRFHLRSEI